MSKSYSRETYHGSDPPERNRIHSYGKSLLALEDLSEEEEEAVKDMLWQLVIRFSDEGDDSAD